MLALPANPPIIPCLPGMAEEGGSRACASRIPPIIRVLSGNGGGRREPRLRFPHSTHHPVCYLARGKATLHENVVGGAPLTCPSRGGALLGRSAPNRLG